eukprot:jgi/Orpsp1_1/1177822/evm.model.c7180000063005.1
MNNNNNMNNMNNNMNINNMNNMNGINNMNNNHMNNNQMNPSYSFQQNQQYNHHKQRKISDPTDYPDSSHHSQGFNTPQPTHQSLNFNNSPQVSQSIPLQKQNIPTSSSLANHIPIYSNSNSNSTPVPSPNLNNNNNNNNNNQIRTSTSMMMPSSNTLPPPHSYPLTSVSNTTLSNGDPNFVMRPSKSNSFPTPSSMTTSTPLSPYDHRPSPMSSYSPHDFSNNGSNNKFNPGSINDGLPS